MKERPIIFGAESIRAILAGRKTQTRRVVKLTDPSQTYACHDDDGWPMSADEAGMWDRDACPYGDPKYHDRLWVRETWLEMYREHWWWPESKPRDAMYCVNGQPRRNACAYLADMTSEDSDRCREELGYRWKLPIHMPRWASRLTLELTAVRVERLQDMTHKDALAEGCLGHDWVDGSPYIDGPHTDSGELPREEYIRLWDRINSKRHPWKSDPWVWVLSFKRINGDSK